MNFFKKISAEWSLRLSLGFMYIFSAYDIFAHPTAWYWAIRPLPQFMQVIINNQIGVDAYLKLQAVGEFALAFLFLAWFLPRWTARFAAALATIEMFLILWLVGVNAITFRDIGLLGATAAFWILSSKQNEPIQ